MGPAPSPEPIVKQDSASTDKSFPYDNLVEKSTCKFERITLKIGRPTQVGDKEDSTLILRQIGTKKHKTIFEPFGEEGEFALIEFSKCGKVWPSVGVYEDRNDRFWIPYFKVGGAASHCVYSLNDHFSMESVEAVFYWIESINQHESEVKLNVITFECLLPT